MRGPHVRFLARSPISFFSRRAYISRDLSTLGGTKGAQTHTFSRKYDGAGDALWRGGVVQDRGSLDRALKGNYSVYRYDVLPNPWDSLYLAQCGRIRVYLPVSGRGSL